MDGLSGQGSECTHSIRGPTRIGTLSPAAMPATVHTIASINSTFETPTHPMYGVKSAKENLGALPPLPPASRCSMASANPLVIHVETRAGSSLGEIMNSIRSWLDSQKIQPTTFKTVIVGSALALEIAFRQEDEAWRFRQQFGDTQLA